MTEDVLYRDIGFAILCELWPVLCDRVIDVDNTTVVQHKRYEKRHGLGGGPNVDESIFLPFVDLGFFFVTAPDVYDNFTLVNHTN